IGNIHPIATTSTRWQLQAITHQALDKVLRDHNFQETRDLYNTLPDDHSQPHVTNDHIQNLAAIFVRHNAHDVLGVHLIHGHFQIPEDTVLLGNNFEKPEGRWAKPTKVDTIDLDMVHGHVFMLKDDGVFRAYEYQGGALPDLSRVGKDFLPEFADYLRVNGLTNLLGLQVLGCGSTSMSELILEGETVMVDGSAIMGCEESRTTGWRFEMVDGEPRVCRGQESHSKMTSGNHKVFIDGKPLPRLENVDHLKQQLAEAGILSVAKGPGLHVSHGV
ncbi:hypothetical protein CDV36_016401, partial [Fusarium kuroshium]